MKAISHSTVASQFVRASKIHVFIGLAFVAQIIAYDAGKLITADVVFKRWVASGLLIAVASTVWYIARTSKSTPVIHRLAWFLIAADIALASFYIYTQRGMASRAVIFFVLPILVAATLQRKGPIYLAAVLSVVTYFVTAIAYFTFNFNEGYKIELYGEVGFYSAIIFAVAGLSWNLVRHRH